MQRTIITHTLAIATHPARFLTRMAQRHFQKNYAHRRFARMWFAVDLGLLAIALSLFGILLAVTVFAPQKIEQLVRVDATVAPTEVVSGASSTLVFRYENTSKEILHHAELTLSFPEHFSLQAVDSGQTEVASSVYDLGEIPAGASGTLKLRGVMFGDVGGDQTFMTTMRFVYGEKNIPVTKMDTQVFHPVASTLTLSLVLPERVVEGQTVRGEIHYKNTGTIDVPEIAIQPTWPEHFKLVESSPSLRNGLFQLKALKAGEEGTITFTGELPAQTSIHFSFAPSFTFGQTFYKQEVLEQDVALLPSQLSVTSQLENSTLTPGTDAVLKVDVQHVGEETVENVKLIMKTTSPLVVSKTMELPIGELAKGGSSGGRFEVPIARTLARSQTDSFENLTATFNVYVSYTLPDKIAQEILLFTGSVTGKVTSPVILSAFGRYSSPQGDQLGRGPLPPTVDETTKYWIFLTLDGTTSTLTDLKLDAELGESVTFTGRQSVSVGQSLSYDEASGTVHWTIDSLPPTLDPQAKTVSVAFEVALTPTAAMLGTMPTLVQSPLVTGRDSWTGAFVSARGATVTTDLPHDSMAADKGNVTR